jgi:ribosomal protein S18 acetylase RimI-like enzyme
MTVNRETSIAHDYAIRPARPADCAAMQAADLAATEMFRPTGLVDLDIVIGDADDNTELYVSSMAEGWAWVAVETKQDSAVGYVHAKVEEGEVYIEQLSVDPAHGRRGLGRALVEAVCAAAYERGFHTVVLSTFRELPWNGPFYRGMGFEEIGETALLPWMTAVREREKETMDIVLRCFMRKAVS